MAFYNKKKKPITEEEKKIPEKIPISYIASTIPSDIVQKVHEEDKKKIDETIPLKEELLRTPEHIERIAGQRLKDSPMIKELEAKLAKLEAMILQQPQIKPVKIPTYEQLLQYVKSKQASSSICAFLYKRIEKNPKKPDRVTIMKALEVIREMNE